MFNQSPEAHKGKASLSLKPHSQSFLTEFIIGPRDDLSYGHLLVWLQWEKKQDNAINKAHNASMTMKGTINFFSK